MSIVKSLNRSFAARLRAPVVALALAGCGGGTELLIIPFFAFGFSGSNGAVPISLFVGPDSPPTASGNFDFANLNVDDGRALINYTGRYNSCSFTLSTAAAVTAPAAASYAGSFTGKNTIVLRPTSGVGLPTLTLQRQGDDTRQTGC